MTKKISRRAALGLAGGVAVGAATIGLSTADAARRGKGDGRGDGRGDGAGGAQPRAAGPWVRLAVVTANIGRKHLDQREAAITAVRQQSDGTPPMVGWQEIGEGANDTGEPSMIRQHFGDQYTHMFLNDPQSPREPISVPRPWTVVGHTNVFVHEGIADVTPPRWINEVVVQHETMPDLQFVIMNTHYIARAYVGPQRDDLKPYWNHHHDVHAQRVLERHQNQHLPVIWTADTNRNDFGTATGWQAEGAAFGSGLDRIDWLTTNKVDIELLNTNIVPMHVDDDHNAKVAIFRIRLAA
jgi:hypothetical protein